MTDSASLSPFTESVNREQTRGAFIAAHGWQQAAITALPGDASFRRYFRLLQGDRSAMLMDAPPPQEDIRPFCHIARLLQQRGLSTPQIQAEDPLQGFVLLEDFGDDTYTRLLARGGDEVALYQLAVDVLLQLAREGVADAAALPAYDEALLLREVMLYPEWAMPDQPALATDWQSAWQQVLQPVAGVHTTLVLRDYHVDNLMLRPGRSGIQACGLLDFQDAVRGHPAYDLVSLLQDARRDVPAPLQEALYQRFVAQLAVDAAAFARDYAILGAQRAFKIIGIFNRLHRRDGKPHYLQHLPRVVRLAAKNLAHPALAPIQTVLEQYQVKLG